MALAWITGAGGLIGHHVLRAVPPTWQVRAVTRDVVDLTDFDRVRELFRREQPTVVVHCAALSSIAGCAANPKLAERVNVDATRHLAELSANIRFIFFSTDLVFDGAKGNYHESDSPSPLSLYAETKLRAEQGVLSNPQHVVLRTALTLGSSPKGDRSADEQLRVAWSRGEVPSLYADEFRTPIPAEVTARIVWHLLENNAAGLFHLGGAERISRFELGQLVGERWPELKPTIRKASLAGTGRPPDVSLNTRKLQAQLPFLLPRISDWLRAAPKVGHV
jgi:dTDP-4-dehydrorhamnose reductase